MIYPLILLTLRVTDPLLSTDNIMAALFCFSSVFFPEKDIILFFSFAHFLIKLYNQSVKHYLVKYLKVIFAIFLI